MRTHKPLQINAGWLWIVCGLLLTVSAVGAPTPIPLLGTGLIGLGVGLIIAPAGRAP